MTDLDFVFILHLCVIWMIGCYHWYIKSMSYPVQVKMGYRKNWTRNSGTSVGGLTIFQTNLYYRVIKNIKNCNSCLEKKK